MKGAWLRFLRPAAAVTVAGGIAIGICAKEEGSLTSDAETQVLPRRKRLTLLPCSGLARSFFLSVLYFRNNMFAEEGDDDFRWELAVQHCPNQCWEREVLSHHPRILGSAFYAGHTSRMCARSSGDAVVALRDRLLAYNDTSTPSL